MADNTENKATLGKRKFSIDLNKYMMVFALLAIWLIFWIASQGSFITPRNLSNLFIQSVLMCVLALGMVNVIISGQIDLSVGSVVGLSGGFMAIIQVWYKVPPMLAIILTLIFGLLLGLWNGWWIAYRNVPAFIVTLAGMLVFRGVLLGVTGGVTIGPLAEFYRLIANDYVPMSVGWVLGGLFIVACIILMLNSIKEKKLRSAGIVGVIVRYIVYMALIALFVIVMNIYRGIPNSVIILLILIVVFVFISTRTVFGRRIYAIGGNRMASQLAGINIRKITLQVMGINGLMAGAAGIFLSARLASAAVSAGANDELVAIAACVIGGTSLMGGVGSVTGAMVGALIMSSIDNGMSLLNSPDYLQTITKGVVLLLAVWFDVSRSRKSLIS